MEFDFITEFEKKVKEKNINWEVSALASPDGNLYSLGTDSKLIGRIFELISHSVLQEIAEENGFILHPSEAQTVYPDFTLMKSEDDTKKIAIDIKTTYRKFKKTGEPKGYVFTLGSHASFMKNGKSKISYPYDEYEKHYVIGFIYTRNEDASEGEKYKLRDIKKIHIPYKDVKVFCQEKYKIAGEKLGSGNTQNIGSFKTNNIDYLIKGEGPFSELGLKVFEDYWAGYPEYRSKEKKYTSITEYLEYKETKGVDVEQMKLAYEYWKGMHE